MHRRPRNHDHALGSIAIAAAAAGLLAAGCGGPDGEAFDDAGDVTVAIGALATAVPQVIYNAWHPVGQQPRVVDVAYASTANGARVQAFFYRPNGNGGIANQIWRFYSNPYVPGWYLAVNGNSGKCLDRFKTGNGAAVTQNPCNYGSSQDWKFYNISTVTTVMENRYDGRCLHAVTPDSGSSLVMQDCTILVADYWLPHAPF